MRLTAVKIGAGVPKEPFSGHVQLVFITAAILHVESRLVTLTPAAAGGLPGAITVDIPEGFVFAQFFAAGTAAAARGGVLRFADNAVSVDLRASVPWRSRLRELALDLARPQTASAWEAAASALRMDGRSDAIARLGHEAITKLGLATRRLDLRSAEKAAEPLVGLGAGATPAGDDLLVGYLAGLWSSTAHHRGRADFSVGLADIVRRLGSRTNDVSRVYLEAAVEGEASERLAGVSASIAGGRTQPIVAAAVAEAVAVGHTSGADATLGLLLGLAAWGPERIFCDGRRLIDESDFRSS